MKKLLTILSVLLLAGCTQRVDLGVGEKPVIHSPQEMAQDAAINPYTDKGDRLEKVSASTLEAAGENKIELLKTEPKAILSKWNGQVKLGLKYKGITATGDHTFKTDKVEWKDTKEEMNAYPLSAKEGMEDGGLEINVVLKEKPTTNRFCFAVDGAEDLVFTKQLPLWQEIGLPAPTAICTATHCEHDGDISDRPENVIGSYAIYHKTLRDYKTGRTNYATGKFGHVYRPEITDAQGGKIWGELDYTNGELCTDVSQNFLNAATYPVTIDPTLGYTTIGGTSSSLTGDTVRINPPFAPISNSSINYIRVYDNDTTARGAGRGVVYNSTTLALIDAGTQNAATADTGWITYDLDDQAAVLGTNYGIGVWTASTGFVTAMRDAADGFNLYRMTLTYHATNEPTNPFSITSLIANVKYSLYANYSGCTTVGVACTDIFDIVGSIGWVAPTGVTSATVACWGAGGSGELSAGGGGGGGAFAKSTVAVTAGSNYTVTVGSSASQSNGATSTFATTTVVASGGKKGAQTGTAGGGGEAGVSTGDTKFSGGNGGTGGISAGTGGGGGGGAAGTDGNGVAGSNNSGNVGGNGGAGDNGFGGAGGAGSSTNGGNGVDNVLGGGGGGGGGGLGSGGIAGKPGSGSGGSGGSGSSVFAGGTGWCEITYTPSAPPGYCGHTGGDWFVNGTCWIGANTTTPGTVYIGAGGQLNCARNVVIQAKKRIVGNGGKFSTGDGCKWSLWNPI